MINLGSYRRIFQENSINGEYLEGLSMFTTEQILRFIRQSHMKWGDFITLCKELRRIKGNTFFSLSRIPSRRKHYVNFFYLKLHHFGLLMRYGCFSVHRCVLKRMSASLSIIPCRAKLFFHVFMVALSFGLL